MSNPDNKPNLYAMFFTNQFHSFPRCFSGEHLAVEKTLRELLTSQHHIFDSAQVYCYKLSDIT